MMDSVEEQILPQLLQKAAFVEKLFRKVDRLEVICSSFFQFSSFLMFQEFVQQVESEVDRFEKLIDEAEEGVVLGKAAKKILDKAFSFVVSVLNA
jgi:hypothetical protein